MNVRLAIVELYLTDLTAEYTINQISKKTKQSYANTNRVVHELSEEGVLIQRRIGPSLLCQLNVESPLAQNYLLLALAKRAQAAHVAGGSVEVLVTAKQVEIPVAQSRDGRHGMRSHGLPLLLGSFNLTDVYIDVLPIFHGKQIKYVFVHRDTP